jgi:hypothetical protein
VVLFVFLAMVTGTWNLTSLRKSVIFEAWVRNIARRLAERDLARRANSRTCTHCSHKECFFLAMVTGTIQVNLQKTFFYAIIIKNGGKLIWRLF